EGQGGNDRLGVHQVLVAKVVQATVSEDLGASLEPHGLAERDAGVLRQQLRSHAAQSAEHRPASMDELQLAVALEGLWVGRQTGGVPAVVAGELASQVGRDIALRERAQELWPVGAVPLNSSARHHAGSPAGHGGAHRAANSGLSDGGHFSLTK
ncbi:hypothetical protein Vretimale_5371, partial [Volvox reticuliferus]